VASVIEKKLDGPIKDGLDSRITRTVSGCIRDSVHDKTGVVAIAIADASQQVHDRITDLESKHLSMSSEIATLRPSSTGRASPAPAYQVDSVTLSPPSRPPSTPSPIAPTDSTTGTPSAYCAISTVCAGPPHQPEGHVRLASPSYHRDETGIPLLDERTLIECGYTTDTHHGLADVTVCFNDIITIHRTVSSNWSNSRHNTHGPQINRIVS
jgi:hypothetical protein